MITFRKDEQYEGFIINPVVKKCKENITYLQNRIDREQQEIDKIQADCKHIYQFYCSGKDKDHYICVRCSHQTEH